MRWLEFWDRQFFQDIWKGQAHRHTSLSIHAEFTCRSESRQILNFAHPRFPSGVGYTACECDLWQTPANGISMESRTDGGNHIWLKSDRPWIACDSGFVFRRTGSSSCLSLSVIGKFCAGVKPSSSDILEKRSGTKIIMWSHYSSYPSYKFIKYSDQFSKELICSWWSKR